MLDDKQELNHLQGLDSQRASFLTEPYTKWQDEDQVFNPLE